MRVNPTNVIFLSSSGTPLVHQPARAEKVNWITVLTRRPQPEFSCRLSISNHFTRISPCSLREAKWVNLGTVNRGDFGQIFINIFMNSDELNARFHIWGLVSTIRATHITMYILNASWLLLSEIFIVEPCLKFPRSSGWLWTPKQMVFQSNKFCINDSKW